MPVLVINDLHKSAHPLPKRPLAPTRLRKLREHHSANEICDKAHKSCARRLDSRICGGATTGLEVGVSPSYRKLGPARRFSKGCTDLCKTSGIEEGIMHHIVSAVANPTS